MTREQKLERIKHYRTRYELVATHRDGRRVLVRYTSRKGRRGMYDALTQDAERVCELFGAAHVQFAKRADDGGTMGDWSIRFSGRTQREAIIEGELPFYTSLAESVAVA